MRFGTADAIDPMDQSWTSGILKTPVDGPLAVGTLNLAGDGQADLVHHGGPDKAVLAYSAEHYPAWRDELAIAELTNGAFGENLTVRGLTERDVCIGDLWRANDVLFQVSQPRQPCWKLGRRWRRADLPKRVLQTGRSGWYLRVLQEGTIQSGFELALEERRYPEWTVTRVAELRYAKSLEREAVAILADLDELAGSWRKAFADKLAGEDS